MDCSPPGSSVQARILEWVAISSSRGSSNPKMEPESVASPTLSSKFFTTSENLSAMHMGCFRKAWWSPSRPEPFLWELLLQLENKMAGPSFSHSRPALRWADSLGCLYTYLLATYLAHSVGLPPSYSSSSLCRLGLTSSTAAPASCLYICRGVHLLLVRQCLLCFSGQHIVKDTRGNFKKQITLLEV